MGRWLTELRRNLPPDIILHVVGTKADLVTSNPTSREVPFERCIAYVAENLAPGGGATPPATATPGVEWPGRGIGSSAGEGGRIGGMFGGAMGVDGAKSPSSKRSSGFWGQEIGWDCCHEVSAESGEGVEEVFRVITRKLVQQNREMQERLQGVMSPGGFSVPGTPGFGGDGQEGYFDGAVGGMGRPGGSFRVGRDRRSWFGVPVEAYIAEGAGEGREEVVKTRRKCC